jgi:hypothetical protein
MSRKNMAVNPIILEDPKSVFQEEEEEVKQSNNQFCVPLLLHGTIYNTSFSHQSMYTKYTTE